MRILVFCAFFLCSIKPVIAGSEALYKTHTFEFSIAPGFDYYFISHPNRINSFAINEKTLYQPFAGGDIGVAYIYRPIQYFGVSTGINFIEYVRKLGYLNNLVFNNQINPNLTYTPISLHFKGYIMESYIDIPILLHAYLPVKKFELEFATGPEFIFPVLNTSKYTVSSDSAIFNQSINTTHKFNSQEMNRASTLGWDVQLTANIAVKKCFDISIGPEFKLIHLYVFSRDQYYATYVGPIETDYYLGIKLGFRFGPVKKTHPAIETRKSDDQLPVR